MNILAIDTSTDKIVLALRKGDANFFYVGEEGCKKHNAILLENVDSLLEQGNVQLKDIDVFCAVVGPGSFTGIRIGVATINAFAMSTGGKIVEVTSLEQNDNGNDKLILLDCKHGNYYALKIVNGEKEYLETNEEEVKSINLPKEYVIYSSPEKIVEQCVKKVKAGAFVSQAKPFYLKKSSAERP